MLVSQCPLRKDKKQGHLTISSPFGFHHPFHKGNNSTMKYIVAELLNRRSLIYLTDCRKLHVDESRGGNSSSKYKRFRNKWEDHSIKLDREILEKEIEIFNPDVILTFGAIATDVICRGFFHSSYAMNVVPPCPVMLPCKPVLALIHPSHHATRMIKAVYGRKKIICGNQSFLPTKDYYGKVIAHLFH